MELKEIAYALLNMRTRIEKERRELSKQEMSTIYIFVFEKDDEDEYKNRIRDQTIKHLLQIRTDLDVNILEVDKFIFAYNEDCLLLGGAFLQGSFVELIIHPYYYEIERVLMKVVREIYATVQNLNV